ncbi:MAG: winged helix-turn-helix domain-containing protein [Thermoproteota archaeon]|nr:winged helix-turn-helix domain-containing protein [Thermoproteota archaeon]
MTTKAYRGRHQIIAEILDVISESNATGAAPTSIMYKAFLSHAQLKEYLSFLLGNGIIEEIPHGNEKLVYKITEKGIRLMQISKEIESIVGLD